MNLPNRLTFGRIILTFVFMFFLFSHGIIAKLLAFFVFVIAGLTDFYDGRIAKDKDLITDLGKFMDPLADKILVLSAFLSFVQMQLIPAWMAVMVISRELLITGLRIFVLGKGKVLVATRQGKHKTVSQMVTIFSILFFLVLKELFIKYNVWNKNFELYSHFGIMILMSITVVLTLISGISYVWENRFIFINYERKNN